MTWWLTFFDDEFADLVLRADDDLVARTTSFLARTLRLRPGDVVLDQGSGPGRYALPLARRGFDVVAVDVVESYVTRLREAASREGLRCEAHVADASRFVAPRTCDAGFNWATSFGFDEDGEVSRGMLARAHESLAAGGRFALDHGNVARVLRDHKEHMVTRVPVAGGEALVLRESRVDLRRGTLEQDWTYVWPDGRRRTRHGRTRLWMPRDLCEMFEAAGFVELETYGDLEGRPLELGSDRCIVVGRRGP